MQNIPTEKPIIISEFPKSGGSWIVSMVGSALKIPCRDIYMRPGFHLFDGKKHPWYQDAAEFDFPLKSVIKSHELPGSAAIDFDAYYVHLFRDGRDVAVSKYFFEKDFCVKNGIIDSFDLDFDSFVEKTANEWSKYVLEWKNTTVKGVGYENFLVDPAREINALIRDVLGEELDAAYLSEVVSCFTRDKFSASLNAAFSHNTFVRKGVSGDWRNHFSQKNVIAFKEVANDALMALGYEKDDTWSITT